MNKTIKNSIFDVDPCPKEKRFVRRKSRFFALAKIFRREGGRIWRWPNYVAVFSQGYDQKVKMNFYNKQQSFFRIDRYDWISKSFLVIIFSIFFFLTPKPVSAESYGISLYPPLLKVNIKPGKSITQVFNITNLSNNDKLMVARIVPFTEADSFGNPRLNLRSTATWITYFSLANSAIKLGTPFTVKANSTEQLILNMAVPETATLRDLYATLLLSSYTNSLSDEFHGSLVSGTVGSNIIITVHSQIDPPTILKIDSLTPVGAYIKLGNLILADNITPLSFGTKVKNDGDFNAETKGIFRIITRGDTPVYLDGLLPVYVLAHTDRVLLNGSGQNFIYNPGLSQIGFYSAQIQIKTDNSNAETTLDIFFFPFKIIFAILIAVAVITSLMRYGRNNKVEIIDTVNEK